MYQIQIYNLAHTSVQFKYIVMYQIDLQNVLIFIEEYSSLKVNIVSNIFIRTETESSKLCIV